MMNKNSHKVSLILLMLSCSMFKPVTITAQQQVTREGENRKSVEANSSLTRDEDRTVSVEFEHGGKIIVDNRTTGRIVIIGWDKNMVEARATSERGVEAVRYEVKEAASGKTVWLKADYAKGDKPLPPPQPKPEVTPTIPIEPKPEPSPSMPAGPVGEQQTVQPKQIYMPGTSRYDGLIEPPMRDGHPVEVHLEVRVPRSAEIDVVKVNRSNVEITDVETPLSIFGNKGNVFLRHVGTVEVRTQSGMIEVENASGFVDVVTTSGPIRVRRAGGDVRALSISGAVEIECARGRVNVDNTDGSIKLVSVHGDVDATTSNSSVLFMGALREDGRYYLKSMSGAVEMAVHDKPPGFTAALSSYRGIIENDFQLKVKQATQHEDEVNRRIIGSYGSGRTQIKLDTFDGRVKLSKLAPGAVKECKMQN